MANLTDRLPTEMQGAPTIAPARPAPSIFETLANFTTKSLKAEDAGRRNFEQDERSKKAAAADARAQITFNQEQQDRQAKNDAAVGYGGTIAGLNAPTVFGTAPAQPESLITINPEGTDPSQGLITINPASAADQAAISSATTLAGTLQTQQQAAAQGTVSPQMVGVRAEALIRQGIAAHPGSEAAFIMALKEMGVTSMATKAYERANASLDAEAQAAQERNNQVLNYLQKNMGIDVNNTPPEDLPRLRNQALQNMSAEATLDLSIKKVGLQKDRLSMDTATQTANDKIDSQNRTGAMLTLLGNNTDVMMRSLTRVMADPNLSPDKKNQVVSQLLQTVIPELDRRWGQAMSLYGSRMSESDRAFTQGQYETHKKNLVDFLTGPTSVVEQNTRSLKILSDAAGIDMQHAMPLWSRLSKFLGPETLTSLVSNDLTSSGMMTKLGQELRYVAAGNDNQAQVHLENVARILGGDTTVKQFQPQEIRSIAPTLMNTMVNLSRNNAASNGTSELDHKNLVHSIGNFSAIAVDANPQWGFKALLTQGTALTQPGVFRALAQTGQNREERVSAVNQYIPALKQTVDTLSKVSARDPYYGIKWNAGRGEYEAVWNGNRTPPSQHGAGMIVGGLSPVVSNPGGGGQKPNPSTAVLNQINALNRSVAGLSSLARNGFDVSVPGLKESSELERRNFYATNTPSKEMRAAMAKQKSGGKTPEEIVNEMTNTVLKGIDATPAFRGGDVSNYTPKSVDEIKTTYANNPNLPIVQEAAARHGVPEEIALRLAEQESHFNTNSHSGKADGLMQISPGTARLYGVNDVNKLSPAEQADLGFRILADNYKLHGTWPDAVAAYHSGVNLKTAIQQNRTDGNMTTADYVRLIAG